MTLPDHSRGSDPAHENSTADKASTHLPEAENSAAWSTDEAGLPVYCGGGLGEAIVEWRAQMSEANDRRLRLGAIAYDVRAGAVYRAGDSARFIEATGLGSSAVGYYRQVHESLKALDISTRVEILRRLEEGTTCFSVLREAAKLKDPAAFSRVVAESSSYKRAKELARAWKHQNKTAVEAKEQAEIAASTGSESPSAPPASGGGDQPASAAPPEPGVSSSTALAGQSSRSVAWPAGLVVVRETAASLGPGSNRGDCAELAKLLAPGSVDALICDPPYGVNDTGGRGVASQGRIENDENPKVAAKALGKMLAAAKHALAENVPVLVFCSPKSEITALMMRTIEGSGYLKPSPIPLIWYKGYGRWRQKSEGARRTHEAIIYAQKGTPARRPSESGDVISCRPLPSRQRLHHHEKPLGLMAKLVRDYVPEGGLVLDPFSGSGSTLRAAELLGRRAVGFETDPDFHELAKRQLNRVRHAPEHFRERRLREALDQVFADPWGLVESSMDLLTLDDEAIMEALPGRISSRVRPLFDDLDRLFQDAPPPPPDAPFAVLAEAIRNLRRSRGAA